MLISLEMGKEPRYLMKIGSFHRGDINDAQNKDYNDSTWETGEFAIMTIVLIKISQQAEKQRVVFEQVALAGIEKLLL